MNMVARATLQCQGQPRTTEIVCIACGVRGLKFYSVVYNLVLAGVMLHNRGSDLPKGTYT